MERLIEMLRRVKSTHPHLRVGQILSNAAGYVHPESGGDPFFFEDADLARAVEVYAMEVLWKPAK